MCSPTAAVAIVGGAAVGLQTYGSYKAQAAANAAASYNARMAEQSAKIREEQAYGALWRGDRKARKILAKANLFQGAQRAAFSTSGVKVGKGSARGAVEATAALSAEEAFMAKHNAALEAWGFRTQAGFDTARARLYKASKSSPWLPAAGTALGGAFQILGMTAQMNPPTGH